MRKPSLRCGDPIDIIARRAICFLDGAPHPDDGGWTVRRIKRVIYRHHIDVCALDLEALATADNLHLIHDVCGILRCYLPGQERHAATFAPRYAVRPMPDREAI